MRLVLFTAAVLFLPLVAQAQSHPDRVPGRLIVHHTGRPADPAAMAMLARHGATVSRRLDALGVSVIEVAPGMEETIRQSLQGQPLFGEVEFDYYARPGATPNDPYFGSEWHLAKIQAPLAWNLTTGSSIPIAVVDSGIDGSHPDIASRLMAGWNFVTNSSNTSDVTGHGTAVAGALGAIANNGIGVAGVTWLNPIMPLVAVDSTGYAAYSSIAAAIQYAADHGARVINVSLGGSAASSVLQSAVTYAWNAGAVVVAAAMNNSSSTPMYPAACTHAIAVSATDENDNLTSFSDYGNWITLSAPGQDIETTQSGGTYGMWWGTSLAAPIASGVAALALAANPSLTPQALTTLLEQNADDLGPAGYDSSYGWGRVNAYRTVTAALGGTSAAPPPPPPPTGFPMLIHAGGGAYTDAAGQVWAADYDYSGGGTWSVGNNIGNTSSPGLYQTCRWGNFSYNAAVPNGSYTVTLKFAEISATGPNQRVFNVALNGGTVLSNFDIYAQAGGAFTALDKSFTVAVTGGWIIIQFTNGWINSPMVNAIEIAPATKGTSSSGSQSILVHAGGGSYTDSLGQTWAADYSYSGGATWNSGNPIKNTNDSTVYQTCRYGNFTYTFGVTNGSYTVLLKFAELSATGAYQRVFNVSINGTPVLQNFDIFATAGGAFIALDKAFPVSVTNGQISIQFTSGSANLPMVNAIAIIAGSDLLVHAGGGSYTDALGRMWAADNDYSGGGTWSTGNSILNTTSPGLYQTCRWGTFAYSFPVPNGNYTVTLKFAELSAAGPNQRAFNVVLNGATVLNNFDIFAASGGAFVAIDKTFTVTVTGGALNVQFTNGWINAPLVNAIEISPAI